MTSSTSLPTIKRKTKIICTIGPATASFEKLKALYEAGMDVVRLNMSHGSHIDHAKVIKAIRTLNRQVKHTIPVLLDTQGPEIRTGQLTEDLNLHTGNIISLVARGEGDVEQTSIHVDYEDLVHQLKVGDKITVDNGLINLEVLEKMERLLRCRVIDGGLLKNKQHVNLPGVRVNLPAITDKDRDDIRFGLAQGVDYIALSFTRESNDIDELRELLGAKAEKIKIIAKIEDQEGVRNVKSIIKKADGVMVARGDLGVEVNFYELPLIQRRIVRLCAKYGKRVIVATHLMESMIRQPMPTRAEVTDVANAVYEEADALMLSGETTIGRHPLKCVEYLDLICRENERRPGLGFASRLKASDPKQSLAASAVHLAEATNAKAILVITRRGRMANYVTNCRPYKSPIYAFTNVSKTRRQLALNRNLYAFRSNFSDNPEKTLGVAVAKLREFEQCDDADRVVVISDVLEGVGVDAIQIRTIGDFNAH